MNGFKTLGMVAVMAASVLGALTARGQCEFFGGRIYDVRGHDQFAVGDINGDGAVDIVGDGMKVYLGLGDGQFGAEAERSDGRSFSSILSDVDADGDLDWIFLRTGLVVVMRNEGGMFGAGQEYAVPFGMRRLAAGDLDGDGKPDLVTSLVTPTSIAVLVNRGDGTFAPSVQTTSVSSGASELRIADLDLDGRGEVLLGSSSGNLGVLGDFRDGVPNKRQRFPAAAGFVSLDVGDFDGNGRPDVVTAGQSRVSVFLNYNGSAFERRVEPQAEFEVNRVRGIDVDRDGALDLAMTDPELDRVMVMRGRGSGEFEGWEQYPSLADATTLEGADVNGDGYPELLASSPELERLVVLSNRGDGTFSTRSDDIEAGSQSPSLACADIDGDGRLDLLTEGPSFAIRVVYGAGSDREEIRDYPTGLRGAASRGVRIGIGDMDGDGAVDIVAHGGRVCTTLRNEGERRFSGLGLDALIHYVVDFALADMDGDGDLDTVSAGERVVVAMNDGTGRVSQLRTCDAEREFWSVSAADLDGDQRPEMVGICRLARALRVYRIDGSGTLSLFQSLLLPTTPMSMAMGDVDGDSILDVVVSSGPPQLFLGVGDGTFAPGLDLDIASFGVGATLADMDRDGDLDLVVTRTGLAIAINDGRGRFSELKAYATRELPVTAAVGDLNVDGWPDVAVRDYDWKVSILVSSRGGRVIESPQDARFCGEPLLVRAAAEIGGPVRFQWEYESEPGRWAGLTDGLLEGRGTFARTTTGMLAVTSLDERLRVRCVVSGACGHVTTDSALLSECCPADFDRNGIVEGADYAKFVACFEGDCDAEGLGDVNGDGFTDFFDYDAFVEAFEAGC